MTNSTSTTANLARALAAALLLAACGDRAAPSGSDQQARPGAANAEPDTSAAPVTSIVFVGQKEACSCDRERIDKGWQALQQVLGQGKNVAVKRLQIDVDEAEADTYYDMRSIMVLPGLYFLDEKGDLVEMLQGEVDERKIAELLR